MLTRSLNKSRRRGSIRFRHVQFRYDLSHSMDPNSSISSQVYVVGGDGTHRGGNIISREAAKRGMPLTVCGVPKTIDNASL